MMEATSPAPAPAVMEWRLGGMFSARRRWWREDAIRSRRVGEFEDEVEPSGEPESGAEPGREVEAIDEEEEEEPLSKESADTEEEDDAEAELERELEDIVRGQGLTVSYSKETTSRCRGHTVYPCPEILGDDY
jgi:DnaJ-class molecular chaperone